MNLRTATLEILDQVTAFVASSPWSDRYLVMLERMKAQVVEPCVLAVAGRVKAGKSTLINALLGDDLALVGTNETTATINYFRFGMPEDPARPICCVWTNDRVTWESRDFVNSLQGTSDEALRRAESIARLEFNLPNPDLREVTLVDTPGTDALVGDDQQGHEKVTNRFFGTGSATDGLGERKKMISKRNDEETRRISGGADAVIYLVGQVAHVTNESFLSEFQAASSGRTRSLNAVGVMSKVDIQDDILAQRVPLALSIGQKLSKELNTVVPVSAALWIALKKLHRHPGRQEAMKVALGKIPDSRLERMLKDERLFMREYDDCPVPVDERKAISDGMPWRVFVIIARELRQHPVADAIKRLEDISGFVELRRLVHDHFFKRSRLLRCYRILSDLEKLLEEIRRLRLYEYGRSVDKAKKDLVEFTDFIIAHPQAKSDVANRLRRHLEEHVPEDHRDKLTSDAEVLWGKLEEVRDELELVNRQFLGLQLLEEAGDGMFTDEEETELKGLFGMYASDFKHDGLSNRNHISLRQIHWRQSAMHSRDAVRKKVAELAVMFYGCKLQQSLAGADK